MGINGLLKLLGNAAAPAANAVAARQEGNTLERDKLRQQALQLVAQQRADETARTNEAYRQSQIRSNDALADSRNRPKGPMTKVMPNGQLITIYPDGSYDDATQRSALSGPSSGSPGVQVTGGTDPRSAIEGPGTAGDIDLAKQDPAALQAQAKRLGISVGGAPQQATPVAPAAIRQGSTPKVQVPSQVPPQQPRNFAKPANPAATKLSDQLHERVNALVAQGLPLSKARDQARNEYGQAPPPEAGNVFVTGADSTGKPEIYAGKSKGSSSLTPTGVGKPAAGGRGGGLSLSPEDRQKMYTQANLDNQVMKAYEQKVMKTGTVPGTVAGLAGAAASVSGTGFLNQAGGILGNAATGAIDPEYQRYITAQRSYGRIMGNLQSKRYTDHQAEIERSISGLQGNDLNGTILYKQQLRDASLADPEAAGGAHAAGKGATPAQLKRAETDPLYKKYLQDTGKLPPGGDD